jgi:hypothetical protein
VDRVWPLPFSPIPDGCSEPTIVLSTSSGLEPLRVASEGFGEKSPLVGWSAPNSLFFPIVPLPASVSLPVPDFPVHSPWLPIPAPVPPLSQDDGRLIGLTRVAGIPTQGNEKSYSDGRYGKRVRTGPPSASLNSYTRLRAFTSLRILGATPSGTSLVEEPQPYSLLGRDTSG